MLHQITRSLGVKYVNVAAAFARGQIRASYLLFLWLCFIQVIHTRSLAFDAVRLLSKYPDRIYRNVKASNSSIDVSELRVYSLLD